MAELYRTRGLSTDTAVESGYVVHGLGIRGLNADRRIRRVLIVGPGLDLAPRTGSGGRPPQSYQPWAVMDALLSLGLARSGELEIVGADINPRVVEHLRQTEAPTLKLTSEIGDRETVTLMPEYRSYLQRSGVPTLGGSGGHHEPRWPAPQKSRRAIRHARARRRDARHRDRATRRFRLRFRDRDEHPAVLRRLQLALALANIAAMLAPGGFFVHNEHGRSWAT